MIVVENVCLSLANQSILNAIRFRAGVGESLLLLGSNGAGKSTLIRVLLGLQPVDAGSVTLEFNGKSYVTNSARTLTRAKRQEQTWRRHVGYIPQRSQLVGKATALTNVVHGFAGFPGDWRCCVEWLAPGWMRDRAMGQLAAVGLADKAKQLVESLSGGEAQRCAIARALVREPELILADEPTASLDPVTRREVVELLMELATERKATLLMSSHQASEIVHQFDRVLALRNGAVAIDATSTSINDEELARVYADTEQRELASGR